MSDLGEEVARELARVTERLGSMPLPRLATTTGAVYECARALVHAGRTLGVPIPADVEPPELRPQAYGDLIAVLGHDCLDAAGATAPHPDREAGLQAALDALVALRRSLP